jgi:hypothetical protein
MPAARGAVRPHDVAPSIQPLVTGPADTSW